MKKPLVSIIIPTYNRADLLREALASVLAQTYKNWECIIVDDGSTDNTEEVISIISENDKRVHFYVRPLYTKKGASSCRNFGLEKSRGELVQFLDSDDLLKETKLTTQINSWKNEKRDTLLTCKWGGFEDPNDLDSRFKYKYNSYRTFDKNLQLLDCLGFYNEFFPLHAYLIPRDLIKKAGRWNEEINNNDDGEFFTRVILNSSKVIFVPNTSVYYRYNSSNKLSTFDYKDKLISAISSWKLIDKHIKTIKPGFTSKYVRNGAWNIFKVTQEQYPELLDDHSEFFKLRKNFNNRFYSIKKNLNNLDY